MLEVAIKNKQTKQNLNLFLNLEKNLWMVMYSGIKLVIPDM